MKKSVILSTTIILGLIFVAIFVSAFGGSSKSDDNKDKNITIIDCDIKATLQERVECRLKERSANVAGTDESCRNIPDVAGCQGLYQASYRCYAVANKEKTSCFRNVVGLTNAAFKEQNKSSVRNYLVLVLYEAQERVEERVKAGTITEAEGARLIAMIVDTKQSILRGESRDIIKSKIQDLRTAWNEVMK